MKIIKSRQISMIIFQKYENTPLKKFRAGWLDYSHLSYHRCKKSSSFSIWKNTSQEFCMQIFMYLFRQQKGNIKFCKVHKTYHSCILENTPSTCTYGTLYPTSEMLATTLFTIASKWHQPSIHQRMDR